MWILPLLVLLAGALPSPASAEPASPRPFEFGRDSLAYPNELDRPFATDPITGTFARHRPKPPPVYTLHCFVVAKTTRLFFDHARFRPDLAPAAREDYLERIAEVFSRSIRKVSTMRERVQIPGYANLYEFSRDFEIEIKKQAGGAWQSYLQRGNWRMVYPFPKWYEVRVAESLYRSIQRNRIPIVHAVTFPSFALNHALVVYHAEKTPAGIEFLVYDPNDPLRPVSLRFDYASRHFTYSQNVGFAGGGVHIYEVYRSLMF